MSTPTSQAPSVNRAADLDAVLRRLEEGAPRNVDIVALSDLNRSDGGSFRAAWQGLSEEARTAVVRCMDALLEERVDLDFGRALRVALDDPSPVVRQLAVAALWDDDGADLPDRLLTMLRDDPSPDVRAAAAQQLGRHVERAATGDLDRPASDRLRLALHDVLADDEAPPVVRRRALEAVASFGSDPVVTALIDEAFDSDEPGLRASAVYAMGRTMDARWLNALADEFDSDDGELRFEAARACGAIGDDRIVPALAALTDDDDVEVRHAAIAALGQIGGRAASRVLENLATEAAEADAELIQAALDEAAEGIGLGRNLE